MMENILLKTRRQKFASTDWTTWISPIASFRVLRSTTNSLTVHYGLFGWNLFSYTSWFIILFLFPYSYYFN